MRIRQVRPEFWTDPVMAHIALDVRLVYIGLWNVADDSGWFRWDIGQLGALLLPYDGVIRRERFLAMAGRVLVGAGRLDMYECGCACIPTLPKHQRTGGTPFYRYRDDHMKHRTNPDMSGQSHTSPDKSVSNVTERNVEERNGQTLHDLVKMTTDPETGALVWVGPEATT